MDGPCANSPLERLLHRALIKAGISFTTQVRKLDKYVVDIEIQQAKVVIEADGALHQIHKDRDIIRDAELIASGYRVFRFNGKSINRDPDGCIREVIERCCLRSDQTPVFDIRNGMTGANNPFWKGGKQVFVCDNCGATFRQWPANRTGQKHFCQQSCSNQYLREHTEYALSHRGKPSYDIVRSA